MVVSDSEPEVWELTPSAVCVLRASASLPTGHFLLPVTEPSTGHSIPALHEQSHSPGLMDRCIRS